MTDISARPSIPAEAKAEMWKAMYFRAQAGMERYMVSNYGYGAIDEWIDFSSEATAKQSDRYKTEGALPFTENLTRILGDCWGSDVTVHEASVEASKLDIDNCGILSYRQGAAKLGIELTFDDPCREYCTKLQSSIAAKQDLTATFELRPGGCSWCFTRNTETDAEAS
ncbi:hypothetical protein ACFVT1_32230 [Streptomyces sp. NPDC057963]|uniref:hypothetical protein n=1 Tax=Streptomyces sp. NPDC057963 TaxID=3346290 RepID=UPI0036EE99A3